MTRLTQMLTELKRTTLVAGALFAMVIAIESSTYASITSYDLTVTSNSALSNLIYSASNPTGPLTRFGTVTITTTDGSNVATVEYNSNVSNPDYLVYFHSQAEFNLNVNGGAALPPPDGPPPGTIAYPVNSYLTSTGSSTALDVNNVPGTGFEVLVGGAPGNGTGGLGPFNFSLTSVSGSVLLSKLNFTITKVDDPNTVGVDTWSNADDVLIANNVGYYVAAHIAVVGIDTGFAGDGDVYLGDTLPPGVPEPATLAIWSLGLGVAGLVGMARRRK